MNTETKFKLRKKGLPKRLHRIPNGVPGLVSTCDIRVGTLKRNGQTAKVAFFKDKASMKHFYDNILPYYRGINEHTKACRKLSRRAAGLVNKLAIVYTSSDGKRSYDEVDRNYFCLVCLVEGFLTAEILCHEAVHVGFAWDHRFQEDSEFRDRNNQEENVCYPAGVFLDQTLRHIKSAGLREV